MKKNITLLLYASVLFVKLEIIQDIYLKGELNYYLFYSDKVISSFIVFCSPFYMPVMFLLAGVSARYALKKRTYGQFISERVKRLIIPFVFGTLFFCPILAYIGDKTNCGYDGGFVVHYRVFFTKWTDLSGFDGGFGVGQFWFLYFLFVLPLPFLYDLLVVGGKSFAEYLYVFLIGYYIFANDNVLETTEKNRHVTFAIALIAGIADVYMFIWSGKEFGNINTVAKAFTEWFMILALIGNGKHLLNHSGKVANYLSGRSYLFFSIHFLWIVLFQYWFSVLVGNNTMLAYILPVACAYPVTFACAEIVFRIPFMRFLMGQKTK